MSKKIIDFQKEKAKRKRKAKAKKQREKFVAFVDAFINTSLFIILVALAYLVCSCLLT